MPRRLSVLAVPVVLAGTVTACTQALPSDDLEKQVKSRLTTTLKETPKSVDCPDDIKAEVDAFVRCTAKYKNKSIRVLVTVTAVKNGVVTLDIRKDKNYKSKS